MIRTPRRWRVRQPAQTGASHPNPWRGFTVERVRRPRRGSDRGLYVVRTPDRQSRVAVVRGVHIDARIRAHLVYTLRETLELGTQLATFWPTRTALPASLTTRDAVGDFGAAVRFACLVARRLAASATLLTSDEVLHA
jgi:hypothetical protein